MGGKAGWLFRAGDPASLRAALEEAAADAGAAPAREGARPTRSRSASRWPEIASQTARLLESSGRLTDAGLMAVHARCPACRPGEASRRRRRDEHHRPPFSICVSRLSDGRSTCRRTGSRSCDVPPSAVTTSSSSTAARSWDATSSGSSAAATAAATCGGCCRPSRWSRASRSGMPSTSCRGAGSYERANAVNCFLTGRVLRRIVRRLPQPVVLWLYDPSAVHLVGICGEIFAVYDCVDDHAAIWNGRLGSAQAQPDRRRRTSRRRGARGSSSRRRRRSSSASNSSTPRRTSFRTSATTRTSRPPRSALSRRPSSPASPGR